MKTSAKQTSDARLAKMFTAEARKCFERYLPRIVACLGQLDETEIWWRPNPSSNSAGNLVLHLCGNIRQWIISGLGGAPDVRLRDMEFSERGPIPRRILVAQLRETVGQVCAVLDVLSAADLLREHTIQGFHETGLSAVAHVFEHFSHHAGQIIYLTKLKRGRDLRFTRLPKVKSRKPPANK
jgi:uncharacterized damage-inducible protein DinB